MICIPMAGLSSRFTKAGYQLPKYKLKIDGETVFSKCLKSFEKYFKNELFVFIVPDVQDTSRWVEQQVKLLGITHWDVITLNSTTLGQADTVRRGLTILNEKIDIENLNLIIFNIDTFRPNLQLQTFDDNAAGILEVFEGEGEHWSFVSPKISDKYEVSYTTEKNRISNLCSTGLYYFKTVDLFLKALHNFENNFDPIGNELYVAPVFNTLIDQGHKIMYYKIKKDEVIFCGTPEEYESLIGINDKN